MNRLTVDQYYELQAQYERTPAPGDSFGASGEHYVLVSILRRFGYNEPDKWRALALAERLLENGYE
jgi:hypothetical protein